MRESDQLTSIFLGMDPYTKYWQFADCFQRKPGDKSQLQIPNDSLNLLWTEIAKGIQGDSQQIQWATSRHWSNKGNSMETLLYMLSEAGEHLLFWQALWVIFMHQHQDLNAS